MKGIILAGGKGLRLDEGNKALFEYKGKPMIEYVLDNMKQVELKEITIVHNGRDIPELYGIDYQGMKLNYVEQVDQNGITGALKCVEPQEALLMFCDIIYDGSLAHMRSIFESNTQLVASFGVQICKNENRIKKSYGVTKQGVVIDKPKDLKNFDNLLGLGIYTIRPEFWDNLKDDFMDSFNLPTGKVGMTLLQSDYKNINGLEDI